MAMQIVLTIVGIILLFGSGAIGRLLRIARSTTRTKEPSFKVKITLLDVIYAITMIAGILAKEIWDNINENNKLEVKLPRIIGALIVSPIVYAAVYSQFAGELSLLGLAIAFQNGFFWQAAFRTAQGSMPAQQGLNQLRLITG